MKNSANSKDDTRLSRNDPWRIAWPKIGHLLSEWSCSLWFTFADELLTRLILIYSLCMEAVKAVMMSLLDAGGKEREEKNVSASPSDSENGLATSRCEQFNLLVQECVSKCLIEHLLTCYRRRKTPALRRRRRERNVQCSTRWKIVSVSFLGHDFSCFRQKHLGSTMAACISNWISSLFSSFSS